LAKLIKQFGMIDFVKRLTHIEINNVRLPPSVELRPM